MQSLLTVTTPAADLSLLTIEELRAAAGVEDDTQDEALEAIGLEVAALIAAECNVTPGLGGLPTLRRETLTETFWDANVCRLRLARQHNVSILSINDGGTALAPEDYIVNPAGSIMRLCGGRLGYWGADTLTVVYEAGFANVPAELKAVAKEMVKTSWMNKDVSIASGTKSQTVRVYDIEEIRTDYFEGSSGASAASSGAVPDAVAGKLTRFRNLAIV